MRQVLTVVYLGSILGIDVHLCMGVIMSADPATGEAADGPVMSEAPDGSVMSDAADGSARSEAAEAVAAAAAVDFGGWAPDACTLPTAERPLRAADFAAVFAATVRGLDRVGATRLHLDLVASPQAAARTAELAAAETNCCSFFTFALTAAAGTLTLDITVPQQYAPVLDALADRAAAAAGLAS
jgi:hypothetical protein